jgi:alkanesulfonate monooxygenase SsuD/methylene tetrahydromethanopterin reductase-like flavin-dependent oxidoreductase (luciferase family)
MRRIEIALKPRLGVYVPVYKGWVKGLDEGENDPTFKYAAETVTKAEEIGIDSIWVADISWIGSSSRGHGP